MRETSEPGRRCKHRDWTPSTPYPVQTSIVSSLRLTRWVSRQRPLGPGPWAQLTNARGPEPFPLPRNRLEKTRSRCWLYQTREKGDPMANPKCVALQCDIKDIFDKALKAAVAKQVKQTVQTLVDKTKG